MTLLCRRALACLLWMLLARAHVAHAHPLSPPTLTIREQAPAHYRVSFRRSHLAAGRLELAWPTGCEAGVATTHEQGDQQVDDFALHCESSLEGHTLRVFGLVELELSVLVYVEQQAAEPVRALLSAERSSLLVPRRSSGWDVLCDYLGLGVEHLLGGLDHILFVLGLMLLVRGLRARLLALTAFTLGHSVTLCLSALSVLRLPEAPVELGIAASLLVLALEVVESSRQLPSRAGAGDQRPHDLHGLHGPRPASTRRVALMAASFGLLHGLGFASALVEAGLPERAVPLSLLGFNLGVELGQLLVVALLAPCLWLLTRLALAHAARARVLSAYAIGALAALWCIERALTVLSG